MRFDKLTTKFQQALADAQSLALGNDAGFINELNALGCQCEPVVAGRFRMELPSGFELKEIYRLASTLDCIDRH